MIKHHHYETTGKNLALCQSNLLVWNIFSSLFIFWLQPGHIYLPTKVKQTNKLKVLCVCVYWCPPVWYLTWHDPGTPRLIDCINFHLDSVIYFLQTKTKAISIIWKILSYTCFTHCGFNIRFFFFTSHFKKTCFEFLGSVGNSALSKWRQYKMGICEHANL